MCCPALSKHVRKNKYGGESIDFFDPSAVKMLNTALLKCHYNIDYWDIPLQYLCPPIPGRADYIHHIADLLSRYNNGKIPFGKGIRCLDIGVGANCIYPIIGIRVYGWSFVGTDIDQVSIDSARKIAELNPGLKDRLELRFQHDPNDIFHGIIQHDEYIDLVICNPPFHGSMAEVEAASVRKLSNLKKESVKRASLNFGGYNRELWREGGEVQFIQDMIKESKAYSKSCFWFSVLVSKESILNLVYEALSKVSAVKIETIPMGQGNKINRIVSWTFLSQNQQKVWAKSRWTQTMPILHKKNYESPCLKRKA